MNARAYDLVDELRAILGTLPGATSIGLHASETWTLVLGRIQTGLLLFGAMQGTDSSWSHASVHGSDALRMRVGNHAATPQAEGSWCQFTNGVDAASQVASGTRANRRSQ